MIKKVLVLFLALALLCCTAATALAATDNSAAMDSRLTEVTKLVKAQLGIGDEYDSFNGYYNDYDMEKYWDLSWDSANSSLNVSATEEGKILSYYYNEYSSQARYQYDPYFAPAFPKTDEAMLTQAADKFLAKVLRPNESVVFDEFGNPSLTDSGRYNYLYGTLYYNGLPTPFYVSVDMDADLNVTGFNRGDFYSMHVKDIKEAPAATKAIPAEEAFAKLAEKAELKLQYVLEDYSAEIPKAVLRYVPVYNGAWTVDAINGDIIDFDDLYDDARRNDYKTMDGVAESPAAAEDSGAGVMKLSEAELSGIAKLEGVLSVEELDKKLRAIPELGLGGGWNRSYSNYYEGWGDDKDSVYCSVTYNIKATAALLGLSAAEFNKMGYTPYIQKYIDVDAKTGELRSVSSYYPYTGSEPKAKLTDAELLKAGADFLTKYQAEYLPKTALTVDEDRYGFGYYSDPYSQYFNYVRQENDIPFPENTIRVAINKVSGAVDEYYYYWDDAVVFDSAEGVIAMEDALKGYNEAFAARLQYLSKPIATTAPQYRAWAEWGYSFVYEFMLGYQMYSEDYVTGVDAKTGEAVIENYDSWNIMPEYDDIETSYAREQIEKMAGYGVGFAGDSFLPSKNLTQADMLQLLISASFHGIIVDDEEYLYTTAYDLGIITAEEKDPAKTVTRSELAKTLVKMSGYGKTAMLPGIYKCGFSDDNSIAKADYGYIAIAKGLGIIKGDQSNKFNPNRIVNRAEAAVMFYNFLNRSF